METTNRYSDKELEKFKSYRKFLLSQEKRYDKQISKLF